MVGLSIMHHAVMQPLLFVGSCSLVSSLLVLYYSILYSTVYCMGTETAVVRGAVRVRRCRLRAVSQQCGFSISSVLIGPKAFRWAFVLKGSTVNGDFVP
jgi:hypothetical protein